MAKLGDVFAEIALKLFQALTGVISPTLRGALEEGITLLYDRAKSTDTPVDDIFVKVLAALVDVDLPDD